MSPLESALAPLFAAAVDSLRRSVAARLPGEFCPVRLPGMSLGLALWDGSGRCSQDCWTVSADGLLPGAVRSIVYSVAVGTPADASRFDPILLEVERLSAGHVSRVLEEAFVRMVAAGMPARAFTESVEAAVAASVMAT